MLSPELRAEAEALIGRYPVGRSALLPLLHLVQHDEGYVSPAGIAACAELLGLTKAEVAAVATFYTMYKRAPLGRHLVSVCTNFSCKVRGGQEVYDRLCDKLGVGHNETTPDGAITLEHAECLGNCDGAPVVTVDYLNYEGMTPRDAEQLVDAILSGDELPPPSRGMVPPGAREIGRRLAGLGPPDAAQPGAAVDQARADDGAPPVREAGPGVEPVPVQASLSPEDVAEREAARSQVAEVGHDHVEVERQAGARAREFPTRPGVETPGPPARPQEGESPRERPTEPNKPEREDG